MLHESNTQFQFVCFYTQGLEIARFMLDAQFSSFQRKNRSDNLLWRQSTVLKERPQFGNIFYFFEIEHLIDQAFCLRRAKDRRH
jgi:hypothetical protein